MFTLIKHWWRKLRSLVTKTPVPAQTTSTLSAAPAAGAPGVRAVPKFGAPGYEAAARSSGAEGDSLVTSALVGMAVGSMYNRAWEMYGPLDEFSAEQLIDGELDPDARALQARDAGYEGARGDDEVYADEAYADETYADEDYVDEPCAAEACGADPDAVSADGLADGAADAYSSYDEQTSDEGRAQSDDWSSGDDSWGSEGDTW
ncbi:MAG: hypothetical protein ROM54_02810 [Anaerobiospirillum sp.]|nr:hypothetical protein [Anaerobiospirillum sp.]